MPLMRSFSSFSPAPDMGSAFLGGVSAQTKIADAANELQLGREKIAAQQVQANMELQAKQQSLQAQSMRQSQELEVEKAYKEQMIGLKQRELDQANSLLNLKVQEAARSFGASQMYQKEAEDLIAGGAKPEEAYMKSALKYGPEMHLPGSVYTQAFKPDSSSSGIGAATPVEGLDASQFQKFRTGPESFQLVHLPNTMVSDEDMPSGYTRVGAKVLRQVDSPEVADLKKERTRLVKLQDADTAGQMMLDRARAGEKKLTRSQQMVADRYGSRMDEIKSLDEKISGSRGGKSSGVKAPTGAKEGQRVRNKRTGKVGVVRGGLIVPEDEEPDTEEE